jgi:transposase InsO family protein
VPALADEGRYVASESTVYRILRSQNQNAHRGRAKAPQASRSPTTHVATGPRQVWCWDMTYLPATVTGRWFYLYLIMDLYSRKIVGWEVHEHDDSGSGTGVRLPAVQHGSASFPAPVRCWYGCAA